MTPRLWSYTVGQKAYNRIKVYERAPGGPLHIEWWDSQGRHRERIAGVDGSPVMDKALARQIADKAAAEQAKHREAASARTLLGLKPRRKLAELLAAWHAAKAKEWSKAHARAQKRMSAFWLRSLGERAELPLNPAAVEKVAKVARRALSWSARTEQAYLRYIVDAVSFGEKKLKWYGESDNLSAVSFPKVRSQSKSYSITETRALFRYAPAVNAYINAAIHIAYDTQRRAAAIMALRVTDYRDGVIHFPGETDKARKTGTAVLTESGRRAIEALLELPAVKKSGLLFPGAPRKHSKRMRYATLLGYLRDVEKLAKVEYIEGRGLHGLKRRGVTDALKTAGGRIASKQSGTSEETMRRVYDQDEIEERDDLIEGLERLKREP